MGFLDRFKGTKQVPQGQGNQGAAPQSAPQSEVVEVVEVTASEFEPELGTGDVVVIDVRQPWDYQARHIPGALSMPLSSLPGRYQELSPDQNIVLYCYHGISSQDGAAFLMQRGFKAVRSLTGGFTQWAAEGRPTTE